MKRIFYFFIFLMICSCDNHLVTPPHELNSLLKEVSLTTVKDIATQLNPVIVMRDKATRQEFNSNFEVEVIKNRLGTADMYIINYSSGGFVVLSANRQLMPILAYSEHGYFDTKQTDYENSALQHWINNAQMYVNTKSVQNTKFIKSWEFLLEYTKNPYPIKDYIQILSGRNDENCPYVVATIPPLLQTSWGQACGYNDYAPPCQYGYCGKMLTGCVATAMAQYLKFYRFPSNYNYYLMPNNTGAPETARLMRDLGNLVYMNYGCNGSGASLWSIVPAFIQLGYNAYSQAYTKQATISMIREQGKPVYLVGYHQTAPIGHAWIADGYKEIIPCDFSETIEFMHMNWGFSNNPPNGWFIDLGDYPVAASMIIANPQ